MFDVEVLPLPGWHRPLAAAFADRVGPTGSLRTLSSARTAWDIMRRFIRALHADPEAPQHPGELTAGHVERFLASRRLGMAEQNVATEMREIARVLREPALRELVNTEAYAVLSQRFTRSRPDGRPGYSDEELNAILGAARADVAALRDRIASSERLLAGPPELADDPDPSTAARQGWEHERLLRETARTGIVPDLGRAGLQRLAPRRELASELFVTWPDVTPLLVLLVAATGRNIETIKELPAEHRILEGRAVELRLIKRRRGARHWHETVTWEIGPPHRALHTPGGLYLLLHRLCARSRAFTTSGRAWAIWRNGHYAGVSGVLEHYDPFDHGLHVHSPYIRDWVATHWPPDQGTADPIGHDPDDERYGHEERSDAEQGAAPDDLERFRLSFNRLKTSIDVRRTRRLGGHLPSAARSNTIPVLFTNYLRGDPTTIDWAQQVIGDALADAEHAALDTHRRAAAATGGGPHITSGDPAKDGPRETTEASVTAEAADTGWSSCSDPEQHPNTGTRCQASFLDCFHCGNALITEAHLPRLVSLLDALDERHQQMNDEDWWRRYGPAWAALRHDILPRFSPAELDRAATDKPEDPARPRRSRLGTTMTTPHSTRPPRHHLSPALEPGRSATQSESGDGRLVLAARPLRSGIVLEQTSRFADDIWRLAPALLQDHQKALALPFDRIPARHRATVKELCFGMLSGPLPVGERRGSIHQVHSTFNELKRFLRWHEQHAGNRDLARLRGRDLLDYQAHLLDTLPGRAARAAARAAVRMLWRFRQSINDQLPFDPLHLEGWGEARSGRSAAENATDRIPEAVLGPLIGWALRFVDDFAVDILDTDTERQDLQLRAGDSGHGDVAEKLRLRLQLHRERRLPLPGRGGALNRNFLALQVGCRASTLARPPHRPIVDAAVTELGIAELSPYDTPITATLAGRPWIDHIVNDHRRHQGLAPLSRHLQAACYIVIAFLSGMRESEIKHLRRGCLHLHRDSRGTPVRWTLTSLAFKGESDPHGVTATWTVGHPAARAVAVLERLQPPSTELLFATLLIGPAAGPGSVSDNPALSTTATINQLNAFTAWVNDHAEQHELPDRIPHVDGKPWRLTSRQFRRTLAWFIARRPGGAIAGAIHYRHHAVQMFEGYAGTSDSGFRAEVESEQALARGEQLLTLVERHEHTRLTGPAGTDAARRLEVLGEQARFTGTVVTDRRRLARLLRRHDPAVYPGTYVTCVFNPDTALCLPRDSTATPTPATAPAATLAEVEGPRVADCQPLRCRNTALTSDNDQAWRTELTRIDQQLTRRPPLPPLLAARLHTRREEINAFLDRNRRRH